MRVFLPMALRLSIFANDAPMDLHSSDLLVSENQPIGTLVGEFNATDPDGDILTYSLVNGVGATDNAWFTLETNGTLRTATVLITRRMPRPTVFTFVPRMNTMHRWKETSRSF